MNAFPKIVYGQRQYNIYLKDFYHQDMVLNTLLQGVKQILRIKCRFFLFVSHLHAKLFLIILNKENILSIKQSVHKKPFKIILICDVYYVKLGIYIKNKDSWRCCLLTFYFQSGSMGTFETVNKSLTQKISHPSEKEQTYEVQLCLILKSLVLVKTFAVLN